MNSKFSYDDRRQTSVHGLHHVASASLFYKIVAVLLQLFEASLSFYFIICGSRAQVGGPPRAICPELKCRFNLYAIFCEARDDIALIFS